MEDPMGSPARRLAVGLGPLRVMNDDLVQPSRGFGTHPHQDAEIMT
jgi:redox-sensitive bicupin YhaK (pirin superfamily)